jgi:N-hydroxyarylamine O-acetyltransferase
MAHRNRVPPTPALQVNTLPYLLDSHTLQIMDIQAYLDRIQATTQRATAQPAPTLDFLAYLQAQHLLTTPFENLSVMGDEPIVLSSAALFDKIVNRRRGGFCYELNGLFAALLSHLGFSVQMVSAQVYQAEQPTFGPPFDHLALLVTLGETRYLVDVGFGDSCRTPLLIPDGVALNGVSTADATTDGVTTNGVATNGVTTDVSGAYRIVAAGARPGATSERWVLEKQTAQGWSPQFLFNTASHGLEDFAAMCAYHREDRASHFTRRMICSIATPHGRYTLSNDRLIITHKGHRAESIVAGPHISRRILRAYFGVDLQRDPSLAGSP